MVQVEKIQILWWISKYEVFIYLIEVLIWKMVFVVNSLFGGRMKLMVVFGGKVYNIMVQFVVGFDFQFMKVFFICLFGEMFGFFRV